MKAEKTHQESPSRTIQSKPGGGGVYMEDNRAEAVRQAKMINEIEGCPNKDLPAQFYSIKKIKGKNYKCSENEKYITEGGENAKNVLYCISGERLPDVFPKMSIEPETTIENYTAFKYVQLRGKFDNDCGAFAVLLCNKILGIDKLPIPKYLQLYPLLTNEDNKKNLDVFKYWEANQIGPKGGYNDPEKENRRKDFSRNENANPGIGEAYFIGPSKKLSAYNRSVCPHHVAAVIAKDGSDNITCEADAGRKGAKEPVFDMYGTKTDTEENIAQTFHCTYQKIYSSDGDQKAITKGGKELLIPNPGAVTGVAVLPPEKDGRSESKASKKKRPRSDDEAPKKKRKIK